MNLEGGAQRHIDASLTDLGQQQAVALAAWLPNKIATIDALYSSTLQRARETAREAVVRTRGQGGLTADTILPRQQRKPPTLQAGSGVFGFKPACSHTPL